MVQDISIPEPKREDKTFMRFFTDGGARNPTCPLARIASWSVIEDLSQNLSQQKMAADFVYTTPPSFPLLHVAALGLVTGYQTAARGELTAILVAAKIAAKNPSAIDVQFVTDAAYVCAVVSMITQRVFRGILHKLPNSDLVTELADIWDQQRYHVIKVKSHRSFESARDLSDLWRIAGNFCADMAATSVLDSLPVPMKKLADDIAAFRKTEGHRLLTVFKYLAQFNRDRTQACHALEREKANHNRNLEQPKKPPDRVIGNFDSEAMGHEAFLLLKDFAPQNYKFLTIESIPDDKFGMCLQGANLGKALVLWAGLLQWPEDYGEADKNDWGMSWLELIFNFYIVTGRNLPIRLEGYGAKSVYIPYHGPQAILLPKSKRAASLQILTFRNLLQNMQSIESQNFFPSFKESKCKSLQRLGHVCPVAGVPRRPIIPRQAETIVAVQRYIQSLNASAALHQVIYIRDIQPSLIIDEIEEPSTYNRFNRYSQFMKKLRKTRQ